MPQYKTISELRMELSKKERQLNKLYARRKLVTARLSKIEKLISHLDGGKPAGVARRGRPKGSQKRIRRRHRGDKNLIQYIQDALAKAKKPMRAIDIMQAVKNAGYGSKSRDFYGLVAGALSKSGLFKRVGRGMYTLPG